MAFDGWPGGGILDADPEGELDANDVKLASESPNVPTDIPGISGEGAAAAATAG